MRNTLLIGPASSGLGHALAGELGLAAVDAQVRIFPDGECCVSAEIPEHPGRVIILQATHPPQDRNLQLLYQLIEAAKHRGARQIVCVVPYLAYARQDRRSSASEPLSSQIVVRTLAMLGADALVTVDVHNPDIFAAVPLQATNLAAAPLLVERLRTVASSNLMLVSPDRGGRRRTRALAEQLGLRFWVYEKTKDDTGRTWFSSEATVLAGRHAVVVDDLCSSGSTLVPFCRQLLEDGVRRISICITHMLADPTRLRDLLGDNHEIVCTDSVPTAPAAVSLAPLIGRHLREAYLTLESAR